MTLYNRLIHLISWFRPRDERQASNVYILIDCDTYPQALEDVMKVTKDNIFVHGYATSQIDLPLGVIQGHDICEYGSSEDGGKGKDKNRSRTGEYEITPSDPGHKALFRLIKHDPDRDMTIYHRINYLLHVITSLLLDSSCIVLSKDENLITETGYTFGDLDNVIISDDIGEVFEVMEMG